jgi:adenine phosphoribosyltransferase
MFNDITTLLLRPGVFRDAVDIFVERYRGMAIHAVAGKKRTHIHACPSLAVALLLGCSVARFRDIFAGDLP